MIWLVLLLAAPSSQRGPWQHVHTKDGIVTDKRAVPGFDFFEYRTSMRLDAAPKDVMAALWGPYLHGPRATLTRRIVREDATHIVSYDIADVPVVATRDYAVLFERQDSPETNVYQMSFRLKNDEAPPSKYVHIEHISGQWTIEPHPDGGSEVTHVVLSDPSGSVPAFLAHNGQRDAAEESMRILRRLTLEAKR